MGAAMRPLRAALCAAAIGIVTVVPAWADDGAWQMRRQTDSMSDQVTNSASREFNVQGGLHVRATASCASGIVNFAFEVFSPGNAGVPLAWQKSETYSGSTFGFSTQLTRDVKRWVPIRIRVDQGEVLQRNSSSKFENEAEIVFYDPQEMKAQAELQSTTLQDRQRNQRRPASREQALSDFTSGINEALGAMAMAGLPALMPMLGVGTFDVLRSAREIRVELPLADGRAPIVVFSPAAPGLQTFLNGCDGASSTAAFEGVFVNGPVRMVFRNGQVIVLRGGGQSPPASFRRSGNHVLITDPNHETHQIDITSDGGLLLTDGPNVMRFSRVQ